MKSVKILSVLILSIFLITNVSAIIVTGGEWTGSNIIQDGQTANFNVYFGSTESSITINIKLYDSSYNLIYSFEHNKIVNDNTFSSTCFVDKNVYQTHGNFNIQIMGSDSHGSNTYILNLKVNPQILQNNPPVITSTPITEIDEGEEYSYQVTAIDADNDLLTFSLIQKPNWLSMSSSGLITGTAPLVSADTNYPITIKVSDQEHFDIQDYILTVKDIPFEDTTPPVITILGDNSINVEVFSDYVDAGATAYDNIDQDLTNSIITINNVDTNLLGIYYVNYTVKDNAGNTETKTRTVNVVDTISPTITLLGENPQIITLGNLYSELGATAKDNYDGDLTNNISINISNIDIYVLGSYEIFYTVLDSSGNEKQVIRIFKVVPKTEPEDSEEDDNDSTYSYQDIDEIKYFEQFKETTPILYPEVSEPEIKTNWLILFLIIGIMALIIVITLLSISKLKY